MYYNKQEQEQNKKMLQSVVELWNNECKFAPIQRLSADDKKFIVDMIRTKSYTQTEIETVIKTVGKAPKLNGKNLENNKTGYVATLPWVMREKNFCDILNGAYPVEIERTVTGVSLEAKISAYRYANRVGLMYPTCTEYLFTDAEKEHLESEGKYKDGYLLPIEYSNLRNNLSDVLNPHKKQIDTEKLKKLLNKD